jgi:hypothetical protein
LSIYAGYMAAESLSLVVEASPKGPSALPATLSWKEYRKRIQFGESTLHQSEIAVIHPPSQMILDVLEQSS